MAEHVKVHRIKSWGQWFEAVERGDKTFEIRKNDRGYQKGDVVELVEVMTAEGYYPTGGRPEEYVETGRTLRRTITYVLTHPMIDNRFVVFALGAAP